MIKNFEKIIFPPAPNFAFLYEGVAVMQSQHVLESYPILFGQENFARVVEIGTAFAGLPLFVRNCVDFQGDIITFDITDHLVGYQAYLDSQPSWSYLVTTCPDITAMVRESNIDFRPYKNVFELDVQTELINLIQQEGKTLLICDGGNKASEINLYAKFLKPGDIILGHDYFKSGGVDRNIWAVCELSLDAIYAETTRCNILNENQYSELLQRSVTYVGIKQ